MRCSAPETSAMFDVPDGGMRIGLALRSKKLQRYATPYVLRRAAEAGADVIRIDTTQPLAEQGPFHVIIHKLVPCDPFYKDLESYVMSHPHTRVIDQVKRVRSLQSRSDMLRVFCESEISTSRPSTALPSDRKAAKELFYANGGISNSPATPSDGLAGTDSQQGPRRCTFSAPKQVVVPRNTSLEDICSMLSASQVQFPIISKPIASDGTDGSHALALFFSRQALQALIDQDTNATHEGVVLQQFEEHGGVMFKVYVLGSMCEVQLRPSLQLPRAVRSMHDSCSSGWIVLPRFSTTPIAENESAPCALPPHYGLEPGHVGVDSPGSSPGTEGAYMHGRNEVALGHSDSSTMSSTDAENCPGESDTQVQEGISPNCNADRSSWPQLRELGREMSQNKARYVRAPNGLSMISWMAKTGSGRELGFSVQDPKQLSAPAGEHMLALRPPEWSLVQLAKQLKEAIGLTMFNLDVICPLQQSENGVVNYRVVDINYFPGFDKLHRFEDKFVDFLVACGREAVGELQRHNQQEQQQQQRHQPQRCADHVRVHNFVA